MAISPTNKVAKTKFEKPILVEESCGNVFADLGLPEPELALAKAKIVQRLRRMIREQKLTDSDAATLLGVESVRLAALLRGQTGRFSLDRLFKFLNLLGQRVEIRIGPIGTPLATQESRLILG